MSKRTKMNDNGDVSFPSDVATNFLPDDVVMNHVVGEYPRDWLRVSKRYHIFASRRLLCDPRITLSNNNRIKRYKYIAVLQEAVKNEFIESIAGALRYRCHDLLSEVCNSAIRENRYNIITYLLQSYFHDFPFAYSLCAAAKQKQFVLFQHILDFYQRHYQALSAGSLSRYAEVIPMAFHAICIVGDVNSVRHLLAITSQVFQFSTWCCDQTFVKVCEAGHATVLNLLLDETTRLSAVGHVRIVITRHLMSRMYGGAIKHAHVDVFKLLLAHPHPECNPNRHARNYFLMAVYYPDIRIVTCLLEDGRANPGERDDEALHCAVEEGFTEMVRALLLDTRVNPANHSQKALRMAALNGHVNIVRLLLSDSRIDPTVKDNEAMCNAAMYDDNLEVVLLFLKDSRIQPGAQNNLPLRTALRRNHCSAIAQHLLGDERVDCRADMDEFLRLAASRPYPLNNIFQRLLKQHAAGRTPRPL